MKSSFKGKTAVITGGTRGIGRAICSLLCELGCRVIATGKKINRKQRSKLKNLTYMSLDLLDQASVEQFIESLSRLRRIDILVNNAGINIIEPLAGLNRQSWEDVIRVNLTGPMLLTKAIAEKMKQTKAGKIVNVSSIWGVVGKEKRAAYASSKTGLIGLTRVTALELARYNILVNSICPGFTMTELTKSSLSSTEMKKLAYDIPVKRFARVEEIAHAAVFLCSDLNTYITGQNIVVDGGFTIK